MTLRSQLLGAAWGGMAAALFATGLGTAALLHYRAREAQDAELLAAAAAFAHAPTTEALQGEGVPSPVDVAWTDPATTSLGVVAIDDERPMFATEHGQRTLAYPVEAPDAHADPHHEHKLVVARTPAVTLRESVGPFVVAFGLVVGSVGVLVGVVQWALVARALATLRRAGAELRRITSARTGERLNDTGPAEVRALLAEVNELLDRLDGAFAAQTRFTARAAHELRTPVAILRGELELALRRPRDAAGYRETIGRSLVATRRLADLVDALLNLSRIDAGQIERARVHDRASELLMRVLAREDGDPLVDIDADAIIDAHPALLEAAVANLVRNARVHAPPGADAVRLERHGESLRFIVEDRGPGLGGRPQEPLFARFSDGTGLGLGLPLAREVARRHGGDVWLEPREGGGCRAILEVRVVGDVGAEPYQSA